MPGSPREKQMFYGELAKFSGAGFGIRDSLEPMRRHAPEGRRRILRKMERALDTTGTISDAFRAHVSPLEHALISAGERGGKLHASFQHLASYFGMLAIARREMFSALVYPVFLLHLGVLAGTVPLGFVRGRAFMEIFGDAALRLLAVYAAALLLWLAGRALTRAAARSATADAFLSALPFLGKTRRALAMARFAKVHHICLLAGISLRETLETAGTAAGRGKILAAMPVIAEALRAGFPLGPAFMKTGAFPPDFARSYATAEESGTLDDELARWATVFSDDAAHHTRILAATAPRVLYFLVICYVAWQIISFFTGMYENIFRELEE